MLTRESFINPHPDLKPQLVEVPGVGEVYMKKMSLTDYTKGLEMWLAPGGKRDKQRARLFNVRVCQLCLCDEKGEPLFQESELEDVAANVPVNILTRLANFILDLSDADGEELGE